MNNPDHIVKTIIVFLIFSAAPAFFSTPVQAQSEEQIQQLRQLVRQADKQQGQIQNQIRHANSLERQGRYEEASKILRNLYENHPNHGTVYRNYRDVLISMGDYVTAEAVVTQYLKKHPEDVNSLVSLGTIYYNRNDKAKALKQWHSVLESMGKQPHIYQTILNAMIQSGLYSEASDLTKKARKELNQPAFYAMQLASVFSSRMNYDRATEEYLRYYQTRSKNTGFLVSQISRFPNEPDVHQQVIPVLESAVDSNPNDAGLIKVLADYQYRIRDYDGALTHYSRLERMKGQPGKYRRNVAMDFLNDEEYQRAIDLYMKLLDSPEIDSQRVSMKFGYAEALYQQLLQQYQTDSKAPLFQENSFWDIPFIVIPEEAGPQLSDIVEEYTAITGDHPETTEAQFARYRLGEIYLRLGSDIDRAMRYYRKCIESREHPRYARAMLALGTCHLARGDLKSARNHWRSAVDTLSGQYPHLATRARFQLAGVDLYNGEITRAMNRLDTLAQSTDVASRLYNDILELQTLLETGLEDTVRSDSSSLRTFFRGEFYLQQHEISQAQNLYTQIPEKSRGSSMAPYALMRASQLARLLNQDEKAINWLASVTDDYADSDVVDQAYFMLGEIYEKRQEYSTAIQWYEKILINHPGSIMNQNARKSIRSLQQKTS